MPRRDDLCVEQRDGRVHRGKLQVLLGAEVREQPALAHPGRLGQAAEGEAVDALDGRQTGGRLEDRRRLRSPSDRRRRWGWVSLADSKT